MKIFEEYLESVPDDEHRSQMAEVLSWVRNSFPQLGAKIAWNQPMFTDHGTFIIGFSVSKHHFSVSPESKSISVFSHEIDQAGYTHGSNLFRIKWTDEVDFALLNRIIQYNLEGKADCSTFWRK